MVRGALRRVLLTAAAAALVVGGVLGVGELLRDTPRPGSTFAVADIDCDAPPGKTRPEFLGEVHYYGRLPEHLDALDGGMPARLREAFAKHPKVERVGEVRVTPPNRVRVELVFK